MDELERKKNVSEWLKDMREKYGPLDLMSLLIQPIQRIPRYKLLIEEIIKKTPNEHKDYNDLLKSQNVIEEVAITVNEAIRAYDNLQKLTEINRLFGYPKEVKSKNKIYLFIN